MLPPVLWVVDLGWQGNEEGQNHRQSHRKAGIGWIAHTLMTEWERLLSNQKHQHFLRYREG